jgi:hypothetical protein
MIGHQGMIMSVMHKAGERTCGYPSSSLIHCVVDFAIQEEKHEEKIFSNPLFVILSALSSTR